MTATLIVADAVRTASGVHGNAVLIEHGAVRAVGNHADLAGSAVEERYVGGVIIPGLRDAHFHPVSYAALLEGVSLKAASDLADVASRLRDGASALAPGEPLVAVRLDDESLAEHRLPTRNELDATVGDRPTLVHRYCGHVAVANTAALRLSGVDPTTPDPEGGVIDRDGYGVPTGVLRETAIELVATNLRGARGVTAAALVSAMQRLAGLGLTSIGGMVGCGDGPWATLGDETAVLAEAAPMLPIKVHALVIAGSATQLRQKAELLGGAGGRLTWLGVKRFADGSFGGHTAAMLEPFTDRPGERGTLRLSGIDRRLAEAAIDLGGTVAIHAIGDLACSRVIDLFAELRLRVDDPARLRLEHASVLTRDDIGRLAGLGVIASVQPAFLGSETDWLEGRVGSRLDRTYPFASLEAAGVTLAGGSDCPVEPPHPLLGMALARDRSGVFPAEGLAPDRALALFTDGAATSLREPPPLHPGSPADLVVLDRDPVVASPDELRATTVVETFVDGVAVDVDRSLPVWPDETPVER
jgi:predicted amidohydrolase YtcJ